MAKTYDKKRFAKMKTDIEIGRLKYLIKNSLVRSLFISIFTSLLFIMIFDKIRTVSYLLFSFLFLFIPQFLISYLWISKMNWKQLNIDYQKSKA